MPVAFRSIIPLLALPSVLAALPLPTLAAPGSQKTVINLPLGTFTRKSLTVVRGSTIQFEGDFPVEYDRCTFSIQAGGMTLAQKDFEKHWSLLWDSTEEQPSTRSLRIYVSRGNRAPMLIANFIVEILDKAPFTIKTTVPDKPH